jgi:arginase
MRRPLTVVGALSNVGARPYEDGAARDLDRAPAVLRERGLIDRLRAIDIGDVVAPSYRDYVRPPHRVRNEAQVVAYSRALAERVSCALAQGTFGLVLGGDCSIVLACLLAARKKAGDRLGLVYVDAHADYAVEEESESGAVATMALALATGHGHAPLASLAGATGLVDRGHTALIGRRDSTAASPTASAFASSSILDVPSAQLRSDDWLELGALTLDRVAGPGTRGFWIQLDVDVLNPAVMAAVESPEPGGPTAGELVRFLAPLVRHPKALGLSLTSYDPALDPDRSCARRLIGILETLFAPAIATL